MVIFSWKKNGWEKVKRKLLWLCFFPKRIFCLKLELFYILSWVHYFVYLLWYLDPALKFQSLGNSVHAAFFFCWNENSKVHNVFSQAEKFLCFNWISVHKKINNRLTMSTRCFWFLLTIFVPVESLLFGGQQNSPENSPVFSLKCDISWKAWLRWTYLERHFTPYW